jgi:hypothetical protein
MDGVERDKLMKREVMNFMAALADIIVDKMLPEEQKEQLNMVGNAMGAQG